MNKNEQIMQSGSATRLKRRTQQCRTFRFKINRSHLRADQLECIKMMFVECKRLYNYILGTGAIPDPRDYKQYKHITYLDRNKNVVDYDLSRIGSSIIQDQIRVMNESVHALSVRKKKGYDVGPLRFKSECNSIRLFQYGITHRIVGNRIKIQGIKRPIYLSGLKQLSKYNEIDYTTAHLLWDGNDYYISLTCFVPKEQFERSGSIGIDMGVSTHITFSDGRKQNVTIEESERLKGLQRLLEEKKNRSNNWYKVRSKIKKEYNKMNNKKNDAANKIAHDLKRYETVVIQDEQLSSWDRKTIQHSILGRIKSKLIHQPNVYILDRWFPTTQYCPSCNTCTPHDTSKRKFECSCCHSVSDRDVHAANNMLEMLNKILSAGTVDVRPCKKIRFDSVRMCFSRKGNHIGL